MPFWQRLDLSPREQLSKRQGLGVTKSEKMDKMNWDTESVEKSDLPPSRTSAEPGQCGKSRRVPQTPALAAVR